MKKFMILLSILLNMTLMAKEMEMVDTDGVSYKIHAEDKQFEIEKMEGKVVFLEFFGLNCPACKELMPTLIKVQDKYPNKLKVMAIEVQDHDVTPINEYKKQHGINYATFSNYDVGFVARYIIESAKWKGAIPFLMVINANGQVKVLEAGLHSEKELEEYIKMYSK